MLASQAGAQERAADSATQASRKRSAPVLFAVIGGPGIETPTPYYFESNGNLYQTQKRPMVFEVELSRTVFSRGGKRASFEYFVAGQPAITIGGNIRYLFRPCLRSSCFNVGTDLVEQRYTSYGIGATPFGARLTTALPFGAKFSSSIGAGVVWLNHAIPYDRAKRVNFQLTARPAIGLPVGSNGRIWMGYELFHMSNANTSPINPGINAGLAMFGFERGG